MKWHRWMWPAIALAVVAVAYGSLVLYWQFHFKISPISLSDQEYARVARIGQEVEEVGKGMKAGQVPWRKIDYASVGLPDKEAKLLRLREAVNAFQLKFNRLPDSPSELWELSRAVPGAEYRQKELRRLGRDCGLVSVTADSYILNCDQWSPPDRVALDRLVGTFQSDTERFYLVESHLILFVPSFVHERPLVVASPSSN